MVSVDEASRIVFSFPFKPVTRVVPLADAVGNVLAVAVKADRDFPPFDRVAMDGIAIAYSSFKNGQTHFSIESTQAAGEPQKVLQNPANAIEVMTGAILPAGADTVIRYEDILTDGKLSTLTIKDFSKGSNIHCQAQDATAGELLLGPGTLLSPAEIALLASVGTSQVGILDFPSTAIISSGDELIPIESNPKPHQIRRSNVYAIQSAMKEMKWNGTLHHMPDEKSILESSILKLTTMHDILILSGGVSKGKFDFIPEVLESLGIKKKFHQVSQRPGKPFWFGVSESGKVAFALPGNPVSTYMCFYRYIKPWALASLGRPANTTYAILAEDVVFSPPLTYFLQVRVDNENGKLIAYPQAGGGSGDFANLKNVTGFLQLGLERSRFNAGEAFPYIPFR